MGFFTEAVRFKTLFNLKKFFDWRTRSSRQAREIAGGKLEKRIIWSSREI